MRLLVRADATPNIGMGHRVRCEALLDGFSEFGVTGRFVVSKLCGVLANPDDIVLDKESDFLHMAANADLVVLDHYGYTASQISDLHKVQPNLLVLDDQNNRGELSCRWLLNPLTILYKKSYTYGLFGSDYVLLRKQFSQIRRIASSSRSKLLITLGGSDVLSVTWDIVRALLGVGISADILTVVVGKGVKNCQEIMRYCRERNVRCLHNVENMAELMRQSRLAVSAAGGTLFELACMGVPTVFIPVAENQTNAISEHSRLGWCHAFPLNTCTDAERQNQINHLAGLVARLWSDKPWLEEASRRSEQLVDGLGASRVANKILQTLS